MKKIDDEDTSFDEAEFADADIEYDHRGKRIVTPHGDATCGIWLAWFMEYGLPHRSLNPCSTERANAHGGVQ